jgi:hypothetical protein
MRDKQSREMPSSSPVCLRLSDTAVTKPLGPMRARARLQVSDLVERLDLFIARRRARVYVGRRMPMHTQRRPKLGSELATLTIATRDEE